MARSTLFSRLSHLLKIAVAVEKTQVSDSEINMAFAMRRSGASSESIFAALNRRKFLSSAGAGIIGVSGFELLSGCATPSNAKADSQVAALNSSGRVVIVGAGTAGLTTAYRLMKQGVSSVVFEASSRIGGRMYTQTAFNDEGMFCERGGEFIDSQHLELISLCNELGLVIQELAQSEQGQTRELFFSQNQVRSEEQVVAAFKPLAAKLASDIRQAFPTGEVQVPTYNSELAKSAAIQALDRQSIAEYLHLAQADNWLNDLISAAYVGEYGLETSQQSALNLVLLIGSDVSQGFKIFGSSDESKRIQGGNEMLPKALAQAMRKQVPIEMEHRLLAVVDQGNNFLLSFDHHGKTVELIADQVVLALPIVLLREVKLSRVELSPVKRKAINEWGFGTNSKLVLGFKSRSWNTRDSQGGFVLYSNTDAQECWETSRGQAGSSGVVTCFLGGDRARVVPPSTQAKALALLEHVFPGTAAEFDGNKLLQHWSSQPFAKGSYTCSLPGQYTSIYGAPGEPELEGRLVFAGEHCSTEWSGFMCGAVQSGNQAAQLVLAKAKSVAR